MATRSLPARRNFRVLAGDPFFTRLYLKHYVEGVLTAIDLSSWEVELVVTSGGEVKAVGEIEISDPVNGEISFGLYSSETLLLSGWLDNGGHQGANYKIKLTDPTQEPDYDTRTYLYGSVRTYG